MGRSRSPSSKEHSPSDDEKVVLEKDQTLAASNDDLYDPDAGKSDEERAAIDKKLLRKLDAHLVPWLTLLYLASFLDRTNVGNAKVDGLVEDLGMTAGQYNAALSLFFVSYSVFEPLTNALLKRLGPRIVLTVSMIMWGVVMVCHGLVHNFQGLAACRWFLGIFEAALFPGVNFLLSAWYKRDEFGRRSAIFFSAAAVAGSFGGLLAAAIAQMDGIGGKRGWAWIFILEGLATVVIGVASYWMVHGFPESATFLTADDQARVARRLAADGQASARREAYDKVYATAAYKDWKTYVYAFTYAGADMPLYGFSLFSPTIIKGLGYTSTRANLLSVPPYAGAAIMTVAVGFIADRTKQRGICNICTSAIGIVGFIMLISTTTPGVQYAGLFLGALGIYPCIPNTIVWGSNNFEGVYKRGIVMGTVIGFGNINGVVSSNIYNAKDKPQYYPGHGVVLAYLTLFLFCGSILLRFTLARENAKRMKGLRNGRVEGMTDDQILKLGDQR
ncbi:MAG: hypothetical protein M1828_001916 [Chrysothrix sp. TS-e1954]|nr:MAG: hypothetical protein M1828_001916 [Chrysothrix sp. TS-e1954]